VTDCTHDLPCDCGSPTTLILHALADQLRREHLARNDVPNALAWGALTDPERNRWIAEARKAAGL
jgi:hypothetical protein